jgi:hypothetical protein
MTPRKAIDQAKDTLVNDRELNAILNRTGQVRVPVLPDLAASPPDPHAIPTNDGALVVTFTIEDTGFGRRLMADFKGHKEFAA